MKSFGEIAIVLSSYVRQQFTLGSIAQPYVVEILPEAFVFVSNNS